MNLIDKTIMAISPERALKREVAKKRLNILNSGYGNYGANGTKKAVIGWTHGGGSHREDIEDNVDPLRQRSRDLYYGGSNLATGAIKRLRTNAVGTGLHLKSTINEELLGITSEEARELEGKIEREFAHWANSTNCDMERIDNFYQLQQLAMLNAFLSGDSFVLMKTSKRAGSIYDLRIELIEADRISTPGHPKGKPFILRGRGKIGQWRSNCVPYIKIPPIIIYRQRA